MAGPNAAATILALADFVLKHEYDATLKGNGQVRVTVLYGKPHTGKTLPAEVASIATGASDSSLYSR